MKLRVVSGPLSVSQADDPAVDDCYRAFRSIRERFRVPSLTGTLSNMRSTSGVSRCDVPLPFDVAARAVPAPAMRTRVPALEDGRQVHRLVGAHLTSRGLPPGSDLVINPGRPKRGEVAIVRFGGRTRVGVFDLERGRAVLRSDRGTRWLPPDTVYVGVASLASPTLDGMPAS